MLCSGRSRIRNACSLKNYQSRRYFQSADVSLFRIFVSRPLGEITCRRTRIIRFIQNDFRRSRHRRSSRRHRDVEGREQDVARVCASHGKGRVHVNTQRGSSSISIYLPIYRPIYLPAFAHAGAPNFSAEAPVVSPPGLNLSVTGQGRPRSTTTRASPSTLARHGFYDEIKSTRRLRAPTPAIRSRPSLLAAIRFLSRTLFSFSLALSSLGLLLLR